MGYSPWGQKESDTTEWLTHMCGKEDPGMEEGGRSDREMQKQPTSFCSSTFQGAAHRKLMLRLFQAPFLFNPQKRN